MQQWEYLVRTRLTEAELDDYGADGWQLVSVIPETEYGGQLFYLMRPLEADEDDDEVDDEVDDEGEDDDK